MKVNWQDVWLKPVMALLLWLGCVAARADVLYDSTSLITGPSMTVSALNLTSAGTLSVKLTDMKFPDMLSTLSFALTTVTSVYEPTHVLDESGGKNTNTWTINVAAPITLYAAIFANPASKYQAGMYNVQISFASTSAVPLPASAWFLLSGVIGLAALWPRQKLSQRFA